MRFDGRGGEEPFGSGGKEGSSERSEGSDGDGRGSGWRGCSLGKGHSSGELTRVVYLESGCLQTG